jgi:ferredoxin
LSVPKAINGEGGCLHGITCLRAELVESESGGRKRPVPIEGSEHTYEVDAIIPAIGQEVNDSGLEELEELNWSRRKTIQVNTTTMATSQENVFAVGDAVTGPATVVEAIGGGKKAASAIHRSFEGIPQPSQPTPPVRRKQMDLMPVSASEKMALKRPDMKRLKTERRRITFQQVQLGLEPEEALSEAKRCLRCDICIRCGRCVEICRDKMGVGALMFGYLDFDRPGLTDLNIAAERCIGCGACATNCPTNAIRCEDIDGERVLSLCGTVLNRLTLEYCEQCGAVLGPARYHDYIAERVKDISPSLGNQRICLHCAREKSGKQLAEMQPPHL